MRPFAPYVMLPALVLAACNSASSRDEEAAAAAAAHARNAADVATAEAVPAAATPAGIDAATMLALGAFTIVDPNGIHIGTYRNTGGKLWTGPDVVRGGMIQWEEAFKRQDQMIISAVRQPGSGDDWDIYEISIEASGRVYIAYRPNDDGTFAEISDHTATNVATE